MYFSLLICNIYTFCEALTELVPKEQVIRVIRFFLIKKSLLWNKSRYGNCQTMKLARILGQSLEVKAFMNQLSSLIWRQSPVFVGNVEWFWIERSSTKEIVCIEAICYVPIIYSFQRKARIDAIIITLYKENAHGLTNIYCTHYYLIRIFSSKVYYILIMSTNRWSILMISVRKIFYCPDRVFLYV